MLGTVGVSCVAAKRVFAFSFVLFLRRRVGWQKARVRRCVKETNKSCSWARIVAHEEGGWAAFCSGIDPPRPDEDITRSSQYSAQCYSSPPSYPPSSGSSNLLHLPFCAIYISNCCSSHSRLLYSRIMTLHVEVLDIVSLL
jgi:hypothetical protein